MKLDLLFLIITHCTINFVPASKVHYWLISIMWFTDTNIKIAEGHRVLIMNTSAKRARLNFPPIIIELVTILGYV